MSMTTEPGESVSRPPAGARRLYRHTIVVRITHWINVVAMTVLLMSGLQIFNAHPALYWGDKSTFETPLLAIGAGIDDEGRPLGLTTILGHSFDTTGVLGLSREDTPFPVARAFPAWATLPGFQALALGRRWHFFFAWIFVANGVLYLAYAIIGGHVRRDLLPSGGELRRLGHSLWDHLRLRFPRGEEARRYNVLQKIAYLVVLFGLAPVMVLAGLAMSPRLDAGWPVLLALFGGRQSARTVHFVLALAFLTFVAIHLLMVLLSGPWNNLRAMITGWYDIGRPRGRHDG
jgi:thiosulfate reductase cytochrome b subunit